MQDSWLSSLALPQLGGCSACWSKSHLADWRRICLAKFERELCAWMERCSHFHAGKTRSPLFREEPIN